MTVGKNREVLRGRTVRFEQFIYTHIYFFARNKNTIKLIKLKLIQLDFNPKIEFT